jgi:hypothetical protein
MAQSPVPTDKLMSGPKIFRNQTIFLKTYGLKYGPGILATKMIKRGGRL